MQYLDKTGLVRLWNNIKAKLSNKEDSSNKVTSINSTSTDNQYPSAKAVYNLFNNETVLYDDSTGSNGAITLSDSSANYTYLEIFYRNTDSFFSSIKVYSPNSKTICLSTPFVNQNGLTLNLASAIKLISGTTISTSYYGEAKILSSGNTVSANNNIYITRVVGYK